MPDLGAPDGATCLSCSATLGPSARFCAACGVPVSAVSAVPPVPLVPAVPAQEVRKTVTLLFCDVTGSTALGEQLDPEALRGVMGRYFDVARAAIEQHGGTIEKFVGDAVLAVFGVPEVREDDALRAVRAAWQLQAGLASLSVELEREVGVRLQVRTGVNTGPVVVGSARAGGSFATGDAVNTAARLEQAAAPGTVLLGRPTWQLVRDAISVEPAEPLSVKGKAEPLAAYRLVGVDHSAAGRTRRLDAVLVGRDRESSALDEALERTLELGRSHLVTVLGAPGLGKTRLVDDFLDRVGDRARVAGGRCVSYGQGITYWPIVQVLRQALDLSGQESAEVTRHALVAALAGSSEGPAAVDLVMPLLGLGGEPGETAQTLWAVGRVLEQLATRRPLIVTVDDLHWAEPTLLELLERVRDEVADLPLLLVCQARPELLDEHPGWGGGSATSTRLGLQPFTAEHTRTALAALLPGRLPDDLVHAVALWSGGNPLFVEEVVTHLRESGLLVLQAGAWSLSPEALPSAARSGHDLVPPTVAALLAARLDRLPADERRMIERMAVVGLEVSSAEAALLAESQPGATAALLASLGRRELLRQVRGGSGDRWQFRHVMVRDAAYDALPKSVRAALHERFADHVDSAAETGAGAGAERLAFVAHHLEQAARCRGELAPRSEGATRAATRAASALAAAAADARDRDDMPAAEGLLRRALDLGGLASAQRRDLLAQLSISLTRGSSTALEPIIDAYADLLDETATRLDQAYVASTRHLIGINAADPDLDLADAGAHDLVRLARVATDPDRLLLGLVHAATVSQVRSQWGSSQAAIEEILGSDRPGDRRLAQTELGIILNFGPAHLSRLRAHLEEALSQPGHSERRERMLRETLQVTLAAVGEPECLAGLAGQVAERLDDPAATIHSLGSLANAAAAAGESDLALALLPRVVSTLRAEGGLAYAGTYLLTYAALVLERGGPPGAVEPLVEEARGFTARWDTLSCALLLAVDAILAAHDGDQGASTRLAEEAVATVDTGDETWNQGDVRRWVALAADLRGDSAQRRRLLAEAARCYRAKGLEVLAARLEADDT